MAFLIGKSTGPSKCVFYGLVFLTLLTFGAFFFVGYHHSYEENAAFNAPAMTDMLLVFMLSLIVLTIAVSVWSAIKHARNHNYAGRENLIPKREITFIVVAGTAVLLLVTFLAVSSKSIMINSISYENTIWLKMAGMFVIVSALMILVALGAILYDSLRNRR